MKTIIKSYIYCLTIALLIGCSNQKSEKEVESPDTVKGPAFNEVPEENEKEKRPPVDYSIEGKWSDGGLAPTFIITADSIFDPDDHSSARYEKEGEWAIFYYPDEEVHIKAYKTHPDTLIFESVSSRTKYWRLKDEQDLP